MGFLTSVNFFFASDHFVFFETAPWSHETNSTQENASHLSEAQVESPDEVKAWGRKLGHDSL